MAFCLLISKSLSASSLFFSFNELYLTSGNKASILGNVITDKKTGIAHTIDNTYTLDKVYEFDNNVIAANIYNNHIYKVVKTGNTMSLYKDEKIIKTYTGYLPDAASSSNYFVFKYDTYSSNYSQHIVIYNIFYLCLSST